LPSSLGAFEASAMLTKAGYYDLVVELNGIAVPTYIEQVHVPPAPLTSQLQSNFTGVEESYFTGETITVTIFARDQFENFRTESTTDLFTMRLQGQTSGTIYGPFNAVNTGPGLYSVSF